METGLDAEQAALDRMFAASLRHNWSHPHFSVGALAFHTKPGAVSFLERFPETWAALGEHEEQIRSFRKKIEMQDQERERASMARKGKSSGGDNDEADRGKNKEGEGSEKADKDNFYEDKRGSRDGEPDAKLSVVYDGAFWKEFHERTQTYGRGWKDARSLEMAIVSVLKKCGKYGDYKGNEYCELAVEGGVAKTWTPLEAVCDWLRVWPSQVLGLFVGGRGSSGSETKVRKQVLVAMSVCLQGESDHSADKKGELQLWIGAFESAVWEAEDQTYFVHGNTTRRQAGVDFLNSSREAVEELFIERGEPAVGKQMGEWLLNADEKDKREKEGRGDKKGEDDGAFVAAVDKSSHEVGTRLPTPIRGTKRDGDDRRDRDRGDRADRKRRRSSSSSSSKGRKKDKSGKDKSKDNKDRDKKSDGARRDPGYVR